MKWSFHSFLSLTSATLTAILFLGCNKEKSAPVLPTPEKVAVTSVSLDKSSISLVEGTSETLTATVAPSNADNKAISWKSSDTAIASVDANGKVTALKAGSATVTVTTRDGGKTATCAVTVTEIPTISVTGNMADIPVDGARVEFAISYNIAYTVEVETDSQNWIHFVETKAMQSGTLVFSVDANDGPARSGRAMVKPNDGSVDVITLTFNQEGIIPVSSITLDKDALELEIGETFTLEATLTPEEATDKTVEWSSDKPEVATVEDGVVTAISVGSAIITAQAGEQTATCSVTVITPIKEIEQEALIALYNALDGDHWKNHINWCSEKPLNEWFGIKTDEKGRVTELIVPFDNNAKGEIPQAITQLKYLKRLSLSGMDISGILPRDVFQMTSLEWLEINCWKMEPVDLKGIGALKKLKYLCLNKVSGCLPEEIGELTELETLFLHSSGLDGTLPESIGNLKNLIDLNLSGNTLRGVIPASIGELTVLNRLDLQGNRLNGSIPEELGKLSNLVDLDLSCNLLSGTIPESVQQLSCWPLNCWYCIYDNLFRPEDVMGALSVPAFSVTCLNGYQYDSKTEFKKNQFTLLHKTDNRVDDGVLNSIKEVYDRYHSKGLDYLTYAPDEFGADLAWMENYVSTRGIEWPSFFATSENSIYPSDKRFASSFPVLYITPTHVLVDSEGKVVSYSFGSPNDCISYLEAFFGDVENTLYTSSDYSLDGHVRVLQSSDTGSGIDLILMGDAFSDRQINSGLYSSVMNNAMELFFSVEPYKSFQNYFNVYSVDVVSQNEGYEDGCKPALGTWISDESFVGGLNDKKVFSYALKAIAPERLDDALIVVMMNAEKYGGVAAYYENRRGDYGSGTGVAYVPLGRSLEERKYILLHEAGGHGFSKLADEYDYPGRVAEDFVFNHHVDEMYGFWKNVDFTSDPQSVKWAPFIADERYSDEGIGVFEGACGFSEGVWRPSENSIMRDMSDEFNAPSRYAIWYRIGKLAYGEDWVGTYEDFVAYDQINRAPAGVRNSKRHLRNFVEKLLPRLPSPIVNGHSWREEFYRQE